MTRSLYRVTAVDLSRTASDPPALQVPCRSFRDLRKCFIIIRVTRLCCRNSAVGQEHAEGSCTALEILSGAVQFLSYRHETLGSEDGEAATVFHLQPLSTYVLSSKHTYRFRCCVISAIRVDRPTDRQTDRHPIISQVPPQRRSRQPNSDMLQLTQLHLTKVSAIVIKSRRMRWAGHVARMWEKRVAFRMLMGKSEGTRPVGG